MYNQRTIAIGIIFGSLIVILLLFILPIDVVYEVDIETKAYPAKEWKLIKDGTEYRTEETNYKGEQSSNGKSFVFDRGDVIDIQYGSGIVDGGMINKDSILLRFSSMMHNLRIQRALNEIEIQESIRRAGTAALKGPQVQEAIEGVALAESNVKLQDANHKRLTQLVKDGIISQAELDAQTNRLEVAEQELLMAKMRMNNTSFDEKPEDVAVHQARINSSDKELDLLLAQQTSYTVPSPFDGKLRLATEENVILSLIDTGSVTLLFPFPVKQKANLSKSSVLQIETDNGMYSLPFQLKEDVAIIHGDQQCLGIANFDAESLPYGQLMRASIVCDTVTLREYLIRKML